MQTTHLKCMTNSRVFPFSETLATRSDMLPCDANGHIATGHIADAAGAEATVNRVRTRYLGNPANGRLYPYTEILAERGDLVSIDTEEQWESMQRSSSEWRREPVPSAEAPVLQRTAVEDPRESWAKSAGESISESVKLSESEVVDSMFSEKPVPDVPPYSPPLSEVPAFNGEGVDRIGSATALPDIKGLPAKEAKSLLADWAKKFHGHRIDRRPVLETVVDECRALIPVDQE